MATSSRILEPTRSASRKAAPLDLRPILLVIGILLIILALFMAPPMVADLAVGNPDWQVFLAASSVTLFAGVNLLLMNRAPGFSEITGRQAFLLTTLVWIVISFFGSLPLMFSELELNFADAFFETMSGITTTGSTVIIGLDHAPPGILLWRAILQWLGGIGIIVMGVAILPILSVGGMQLVRTESSDLSEKILPRAAQIAGLIGMIYLTMTFVCATLYWIAGMPPFEAAAHSMTTIATGGFSTRDSSIGGFQSGSIEWIAILFMIIGSLPFVLYIQVSNGKIGPLFRDSQVRWFLGIVTLSTLSILAWLITYFDAPWLDALRHALFNTVAIITGTGYASADFGAWGTLPVALLFFLMCVGGCTGSTTGGIKVFRFTVLHVIAKNQFARLVRPHGVFIPSYNGRPLQEAASIAVMAFLFMFGLAFVVIALALSAMGLDYLTAMSGALTTLANVGPGLGPIIGPTGSFASLPDGAKWLLSAAMLLGRLELLTVLILFTPTFWRS